MTPQPGLPYEWDESKRLETLRTRGVDFSLVEQADRNSAIHRQHIRNGEIRWSSYCLIEQRLYNVVWTQRGPYTRIISLRKANDREKARYVQEVY